MAQGHNSQRGDGIDHAVRVAASPRHEIIKLSFFFLNSKDRNQQIFFTLKYNSNSIEAHRNNHANTETVMKTNPSSMLLIEMNK